MLDLIIDLFFVINKKSKLTVLKNRTTCLKNVIQERENIEVDNDKTCLSCYFSKVKGLNVEERMSANYFI